MSKRICAGLVLLATMANAQELAAPTLGATNVAVDVSMATPKAAPSWADEFDGKTLDQSKWRFDTASGSRIAPAIPARNPCHGDQNAGHLCPLTGHEPYA